MKRILLLLVLSMLSLACETTTPAQEAPATLPTVTAQVDLPLAPVHVTNGAVQTTASGLQYIDEKIGDGPSPAGPTSKVTVNYAGFLADGTKFDSSYDRGQPATFPLNHVIRGWTEGLMTMKVGGKRRLIIPPELAYGQRKTAKIPAGSTLTFDVELMSVEDAP